MTVETGFPELDALLADFVAEVRSILAADFCGAYLQGSFALGQADEASDVDFVIVTNGEVTADQRRRLQSMHRRLFGRHVAWAQHLEGSYIPKDRLRQVDPERTPFLYLDNGTDQLVMDSHCNTAVLRWILREHGIAMAGPAPSTLVEPVRRADLTSEGVAGMRDYAAWARRPGTMSRWKQPYLVLTGCRILFTLETGTVATKGTCAAWALDVFDAEWSSLIEAAVADRADPWERVHLTADRQVADRTIAFVEYLEALAARYEVLPRDRSGPET